eukprot:5124379-Amphidinium_carterae.1
MRHMHMQQQRAGTVKLKDLAKVAHIADKMEGILLQLHTYSWLVLFCPRSCLLVLKCKQPSWQLHCCKGSAPWEAEDEQSE